MKKTIFMAVVIASAMCSCEHIDLQGVENEMGGVTL